MKNVFIATAKSCGQKDDALHKITYDTPQFKWFKFNDGDEYLVTYSNGDIIRFKASRGGSTIYSFGNVRSHNQELPKVGHKVKHEIVDIAKSLKQLEL